MNFDDSDESSVDLPGMEPVAAGDDVSEHTSDDDYDTDDRERRVRERALRKGRKVGRPAAIQAMNVVEVEEEDRPEMMLGGSDYTSSGSERGFGTIGGQSRLKVVSSGSDETSSDEEPLSLTLPTLSVPPPDNLREWSRSGEFNLISPGFIYCAGFSPLPLELPDVDEHIILYETANGTLGKALLTNSPTNVEIRWNTHNTLLPGLNQPYSSGDAVVYVKDPAKNAFNFSFGCYGEVDGLGRWGEVPADIIVTWGGGGMVVTPVSGCKIFDFNPYGGGEKVVLECFEDATGRAGYGCIDSFKWQPPDVLSISDEGLEVLTNIMARSLKNGGLTRTQFQNLLTKLFGEEAVKGIADLPHEDGEESPIHQAHFYKLFGIPTVRFLRSPYTTNALWGLVSPDLQTAPFASITRLLDRVIVSQSMPSIVELLIHIVFNGKSKITRHELKKALATLIGTSDATEIVQGVEVLRCLFQKKRAATIQEMRYSFSFVEDAVVGVKFFAKMADTFAKAYDWVKE